MSWKSTSRRLEVVGATLLAITCGSWSVQSRLDSRLLDYRSHFPLIATTTGVLDEPNSKPYGFGTDRRPQTADAST